MKSVSIIIPTMGRDSLWHAVASVLSQAEECDEVIIVGDRFLPDIPDCRCFADRSELPSQYGNRQRTSALPHVRGDVIAYLDDDDSLLPGALDAYRSIGNRPAMFRAILPHRATVWKEKVLRRGNCGTATVVTPNVPALIPPWPVDPLRDGVSPRGTDFKFIRELVRRFGGVDWREEIVYECGPR